jgi:putative copper resistance protein D
MRQWMLPLAQALHLLAAGFWIGGLLAIATRPSGGGPQWRAALMNFSFIGHAAVAVVILSGVLIGFVILGGQAAPWSFAYLTVLAVKVALVMAMTGFALYNRYYLVPRIARVAGSEARLIEIVRLNLGLSGLVVLLVSLLGILAPSHA